MDDNGTIAGTAAISHYLGVGRVDGRYHPTLRWVAETTAAIIGVLENQAPDGVEVVRNYSDALNAAADDVEKTNFVSEQCMHELANSLLEVVERRQIEKRRQ